MSRLFLVRHGEATGDAAGSGLSPLGVEQSRLLGERLRDEGAVQVRHGPRQRAAQTAAILGELCRTTVVADPILDDRTPVPSPGQEASYPDRMHAWFAAVPDDERDKGGKQLSAAVETCLADDRPLILVTHAFVVAWFVQQILGAPVAAWMAIAAGNAGLTTVVRRPGRSPLLAGVNDVGHLHQLGG